MNIINYMKKRQEILSITFLLKDICDIKTLFITTVVKIILHIKTEPAVAAVTGLTQLRQI